MQKVILLFLFIWQVSIHASCGLGVCRVNKTLENEIQWNAIIEYRGVTFDDQVDDGHFINEQVSVGFNFKKFHFNLINSYVYLNLNGSKRGGFSNPVIDTGYLLGKKNNFEFDLGVQYEIPIGDRILTYSHHELLPYFLMRWELNKSTLEVLGGARFSLFVDEDFSEKIHLKKLHSSNHDSTSNNSSAGAKFVMPHDEKELLYRLNYFFGFKRISLKVGAYFNVECPIEDKEIKDFHNSVGFNVHYKVKNITSMLSLGKSIGGNNRFDYSVLIRINILF